MARITDFATGAAPRNSNVSQSKTVQIKTSMASIPPNKYATTSSVPGGKRRKRR